MRKIWNIYEILQANQFPYLGQSILNLEEFKTKTKNKGKTICNNLVQLKVSAGFPQVFCYLCYENCISRGLGNPESIKTLKYFSRLSLASQLRGKCQVPRISESLGNLTLEAKFHHACCWTFQLGLQDQNRKSHSLSGILYSYPDKRVQIIGWKVQKFRKCWTYVLLCLAKYVLLCA